VPKIPTLLSLAATPVAKAKLAIAAAVLVNFIN
jgi:hypothetical protein